MNAGERMKKVPDNRSVRMRLLVALGWTVIWIVIAVALIVTITQSGLHG